MQITFDTVKDAANQAKHGVSLGMAGGFEWETAVIWADDRRDYGESRCIAIGYIGLRLHVAVYVDRGSVRRMISLRRANTREINRYARA